MKWARLLGRMDRFDERSTLNVQRSTLKEAQGNSRLCLRTQA